MRLESMISRRYFHLHVSQGANSFGLKPGYAIDLETSKGNGERWDLTNKTHQKEAIVKNEDPYLLTGSSPCEAFSLLQALNKNKVPEQVRKQRLEEGREKLRIAVRYCKERRAKGRYFSREHPAHATSWKETEVVELVEQEVEMRVELDIPSKTYQMDDQQQRVGGDTTKRVSEQRGTCVAQARDACERKSLQSGSDISTCIGSGNPRWNRGTNERRRRDQRSRKFECWCSSR